MDCRAIVLDIANYFSTGFSNHGISFFTQSSEPLKKRLRIEYFDEYRRAKRDQTPRTGHFISAVYVEILKDLTDKKDLKESISNGLVDRVFENLKAIGYNHLLDNEKI